MSKQAAINVDFKLLHAADSLIWATVLCIYVNTAV